jgi:WhiB family redox-sensing transcriptional regulator
MAEQDLTWAEVADGAWMAAAACRGLDTALFFPIAGDMAGVRAAQAVCEGCPVRAECLAYALESPERFGVLGGASEYARRKLRKARTLHQGGALIGHTRRRDPTRSAQRRAPRASVARDEQFAAFAAETAAYRRRAEAARAKRAG